MSQLSEVFGPSPRIFLTSAAIVNQSDRLRRAGIRRALCCAREADAPTPAAATDGSLIFKRIPLTDHVQENIGTFFEEAFTFIDEAAAAGDPVVVYCQKGISRSPSIVIAYLIARQDFTFDEAFLHVKNRRQVVDPNAGFCAALLTTPQGGTRAAPVAPPAASPIDLNAGGGIVQLLPAECMSQNEVASQRVGGDGASWAGSSNGGESDEGGEDAEERRFIRSMYQSLTFALPSVRRASRGPADTAAASHLTPQQQPIAVSVEDPLLLSQSN